MQEAREVEIEGHDRPRLMRDTVLNYSGVVVSGVLGFVTVPFLLRGLGADAYGSWIAALSLAGIFGAFDFGMEWAITREVADASGAGNRILAGRFVRTAAVLYLSLGIIGGLLVASMGVPLGRWLGTQSTGHSSISGVFGLADLSLFASHLSKFANGVLEGLRRFDLTNALTIAAATLRSVGSIVLIVGGANLLPIAIWYAGVGVGAALAGIFLVVHMEPRFCASPLLTWAEARRHLHFGLMSQANALFTRIVWESGPVLMGALAGPAAVVALHIGQRLPSVLSLIGDRTGGVIFPAASELAYDHKAVREAALLESGTRSVLIVALPACALLWVFAPALMHAWIPGVKPEAITVARIGSLAVLFDACATTAVHMLWGKGHVAKVALFSFFSALIVLSGTALLAHSFGAVGAALAFVAAIVVGAILNIRSECRNAALSPLRLLTGGSFRLPLLTVITAEIAAAVLTVAPGTWPRLILAGTVASAVYGFGFFVFAAEDHEKQLLGRFSCLFAVPALRR
jgi:O-antigen/teichoic acid export membrane protein